MIDSFHIKDILLTKGSFDFDQLALEIFSFQYDNNSVYRDYCRRILGSKISSVKRVRDIPFLPISFFKTHEIKSLNKSPEIVFNSSGTSGKSTSNHYCFDTAFYKALSQKIFEKQVGALHNLKIIALLPGYGAHGSSSLLFMIDNFLKIGAKGSGYFLDDHKFLAEKLNEFSESKESILLWGVTHALLDFAENYNFPDLNFKIIETGGMKGRGKELTRTELHQQLLKAFPKAEILSEYGMTELMSQAYWNTEKKLFRAPSSMKVFPGAINDPLGFTELGKNAQLKIIDLANVETCSFIATEDVGRVYPEGFFDVLGRLDYSDTRGCNLLVS